jgi:hypothetical protein
VFAAFVAVAALMHLLFGRCQRLSAVPALAVMASLKVISIEFVEDIGVGGIAGVNRVFDGLATMRFVDVDALEMLGVPAGQLDLALGYLGRPGGTVLSYRAR